MSKEVVNLVLDRLHAVKLPVTEVRLLGRDELVKRILFGKDLRKPVIVLAGPEGSGKYSVAYAMALACKDLYDVSVLHVSYSSSLVGFETLVTGSQLALRAVATLARFKRTTYGLVHHGFLPVTRVTEATVNLARRVSTHVVFITGLPGFLPKPQLRAISRLAQDVEMLRVLYITEEQPIVTATGYTNAIMWNLGREHLDELLHAFALTKHANIDKELFWRIIGGNPGEFEILALDHRGDIRAYVGARIESFRSLLREFERAVVLRELDMLAQDVDSGDESRLWDRFARNNILMYVDARFVRLTAVKGYGIGGRIAFQKHVYYWIAKTMAKLHSLKPSARDVMKTALKA